MRIGKVVGSVVATQKDVGLENMKLLVLHVHSHAFEPLDEASGSARGVVVTLDAIPQRSEDAASKDIAWSVFAYRPWARAHMRSILAGGRKRTPWQAVSFVECFSKWGVRLRAPSPRLGGRECDSVGR